MGKQIHVLGARQSSPSALDAGLKGLASAALGLAGGWILYSKLAINHQVTLPDALPAERKVFQSREAGQLSYYHSRAASGRPLVLVHSVNAAASAYEMRPLFLQYYGQRPVYALDLPGFGFSERSDRVYTPWLFETALRELLETQVGEPADVVALSLGAEFAARAAMSAPNLFNSLVLISPTGLRIQGTRGARRSAASNLLHPGLSFPLWGRPLFDLISTRTSIEYFLRKSFIGPVPPDLVDYAFASAHQPGAEHAPLYFLSGKLFTPGVRTQVYERLQTPTLVLYDRDSFTSFEMLSEVLAENPVWQAVRLVPTLGLPHFDRPHDTAEVLDRFWQ